MDREKGKDNMGEKVKVNIKKAVPEDYEAYKKLFENCSLMEHYAPNPEEDVLKDWLYPFIKTGNVIAAYSEDGEPLGVLVYILKGMYNSFPYLELIGVSPKCRGMGVGGQLLDAYAEICKEAGAKRGFVCVSSFNPKAKKLYESKGYKELCCIKNMVKDGIDEYTLMKEF